MSTTMAAMPKSTALRQQTSTTTLATFRSNLLKLIELLPEDDSTNNIEQTVFQYGDAYTISANVDNTSINLSITVK